MFAGYSYCNLKVTLKTKKREFKEDYLYIFN